MRFVECFGECFLWFSNHLAEEEISGCSCDVAVFVLCLLLAVSWVDLLSVSVAFPGHTHLLLFAK